MLLGTYRGILEDISGVDGTYKQQLKAIAEGGGGSESILFVNNSDDGELDKTWQELYDALDSSILCIAVFKISSEETVSITCNVIQTVTLQEGSYKVFLDDGSLFIASTANDYPILD